MNGGNGGGGTSCVRAQPALAAIFDRLAHLTDRADSNAETTALTAARAIGPTLPTPPSAGNPAPAPQPDDVASRFSSLLDRLEKVIDRQGQSSDRLNNFV